MQDMSKLPQSDRSLYERREEAQQKLVNTAIKHAVHALYTHSRQRNWQVDSEVQGADLGHNEEEVVNRLCQMPDELKRLRTFSLMAKKNAFDLTIKSAGSKTPRSIHRKQRTPGLENGDIITDEVRVSFVSGDIDLLDEMTEQMHAALKPTESPPDLPTKIEPWYLRNSAMLHQVLKSSVDEFGAEVQFLPRAQARMSNRITHHFHKIKRAYDDSVRSFADIPDTKKHFQNLSARAAAGDIAAAEEITILTRKMQQTRQMIEDYNALASFLNHITSDDVLGTPDVKRFNDMLHNMDESAQTLDEATEGSDEITPAHKKKDFTPIFKTTADFLSYRQFIKEKGTSIGLFRLPILTSEILTSESQKTEAEAAMMKLVTCSQLTHACYMNEASEDFRELWARNALANNAKLKNAALAIPTCAIDWVKGAMDFSPIAVGEKTHAR
jgi:hypothetical protein